MNTYPKYKSSGVKWLGEIPEHWSAVKLKYVGDAFIGITYSPEDVVENEKEGVLVLRSSNIQNGSLTLHDTIYVNKEISEKHFVRNGDILLCSRNGSRDLIGKNILIDDRCSGMTFGAFMTIFRTDYSDYIYYFFNSPIFKALSGLFLSSTINQLTLGVLNDMVVALPPLEEQHKISTFLKHQTSLIDQLIQKKEHLIRLLKEKRQSIINEVIIAGVDHDGVLTNTGGTWLNQIPEGWQIFPLKFITSIQFSSVDRHEHADEVNVKICHYPNAYNNERINAETNLSTGTCTLLELEKFSLRNDQVIITKDSESADDIGVPCFVEEDIENAVCGYHLALLQPDKSIILGEFLFRYLQSSTVRSYFETNSNGVTRFGLGKSTIETLLVPVPDLNTQKTIVDYINERSVKIDKTITSLLLGIDKLKQYRQSMIAEAVTGKIDVRKWMPNKKEKVA
jgi:type I restriction enzyme, S subunit